MSKSHKIRKLSKQDIRALQYQCRPGILFPAFIIILGVGHLVVYNYVSSNQLAVFIGMSNVLVFAAVILLAVFVGFLIMRRYLSDIRNGEKIIEYKRLSKKEAETGHEAGSGSVAVWQMMRENKLYNLIVEGKRYRVDKQLYEACVEGDLVEFHIAPKSKFRLRIQTGTNRFK